jgi:hypothetical protein
MNHLISFLPIVIGVVDYKKKEKEKKYHKKTDTDNKDDGRKVITIPKTYF